MSEVYKKTKDLLESELEKLVAGGNMTAANLELTYKIVDVIKDIGEICEQDAMMYEDDYSGRRGYGMRSSRSYGYPYMYPNGGNYYVEGSYAGGYGNNYSNNYSNNGGYSQGQSRNSQMEMKLRNLMNEASNDQERMMIQNWMNELTR